MTELNIKASDAVTDVRTVGNELLLEKEEKSGIIFFGNLDVPMREIDEAIKILEKLFLQRVACIQEEY